jgi:hypothetical protein
MHEVPVTALAATVDEAGGFEFRDKFPSPFSA